MSDDFATTVEIAFMRGYLQRLDDAIFNDGHIVTDDEARASIARMRAEQEFEAMMRAFIAHVAERPAGEYRAVMSAEHRAFIRWLHQRHQREGIYRGGRTPALLGVPVVIDDAAARPRLEQA